MSIRSIHGCCIAVLYCVTACTDELDVGPDGDLAAEALEPEDDDSELTLARSDADLGEDYVRTPFGRIVHRSCVHEVPDGATIDADDQVFVDGHYERQLPRCEFPVRQERTINGWVAYSALISPPNPWGFNWFKQITVDFTVPQAPAVNSGQLIYLFPGLEPTTGASILQPVLQYGVGGAAGGGYSWAMANWYVTSGGSYVHSPLVGVAAGDVIHGAVYRTSETPCGVAGTNCRWVVSYGVNGAPVGNKYIWLQTPDRYDWAFQGALEVYNLSNCNQLPQTDTTFTRGTLYQPGPTVDGTIVVNGTFSETVLGGTPSCSYDVDNFANGTVIEY